MIGFKAMADTLVEQGAVRINHRIVAHNSHRFPEYDTGPYLYVDPCDDTGNGKQIALSLEECIALRDWINAQLGD